MKISYAKEILIGISFSFILILLLYKGFILLETTPMHSSGWELADSAVSYSNFKPALKVLKYELFNNVNLLWSNTRMMGMPLLANDIQAAPLFPLTLSLIWLDHDTFWNVYVVIRLLLIGLGSYLVARQFLKLNIPASLFFILTFGFALYVMRWMNNPWQNGMLAGIWYLYFLYLTAVSTNKRPLPRVFVFLGLSTTVYSMVTCGFPEAAVMSAVLVILVYVPFLIHCFFSNTFNYKLFSLDLVLSHFVGFAMSSYQIFSIIELMSVSEVFRYVGHLQYKIGDLLPFFVENITLLSSNPSFLFKDSRTLFCLTPTVLFFVGVFFTIKNVKKINYIQIGALLCGIFMLIKLFPLAPQIFNKSISGLPILKESYFYVYFFSIFLWFFSYFSAYGLQNILESVQKRQFASRHTRLLIIIFPFLLLIGIIFLIKTYTSTTLSFHFPPKSQSPIFFTITAFIVTVAIAYCLVLIKDTKRSSFLLIALVILSTIVEMLFTYPRNFNSFQKSKNIEASSIIKQLEKEKEPLIESRLQDRLGEYVHLGLATIDTGATPMLPVRTKLFRTNFFNSPMAGHFPIDSAKNRFSWGITSTNLRAMDRFFGGGENSLPQWNRLSLIDGGKIHLDEIQHNQRKVDFSRDLVINNDSKGLLYLKGWAAAEQNSDHRYSNVFLVFSYPDRDITVPTRKAVRFDVARHLNSSQYLFSGWDTYIDTSTLPAGRCDLKIRFLSNQDSTSYLEKQFRHTVVVKNTDTANALTPNLIGVNNKEKIFLGVLGQFYIYLDKTALPRAYLASKCTPANSIKEIINNLERMADFELGNIYLENLNSSERMFCNSLDSTTERIPFLYDRGDEMLLENIRGPGILVLNDNYYPGWEAINVKTNQQFEIKPSNITFRGIILPSEKDYQILFKFKPTWINYARILAILSLFTILLRVVAGLRRHFIQSKQKIL